LTLSVIDVFAVVVMNLPDDFPEDEPEDENDNDDDDDDFFTD
jgi:hypothetical protein